MCVVFVVVDVVVVVFFVAVVVTVLLFRLNCPTLQQQSLMFNGLVYEQVPVMSNRKDWSVNGKAALMWLTPKRAGRSSDT